MMAAAWEGGAHQTTPRQPHNAQTWDEWRQERIYKSQGSNYKNTACERKPGQKNSDENIPAHVWDRAGHLNNGVTTTHQKILMSPSSVVG